MMGRGFFHLLKKDGKLMVSGKFFLLALGSLILYSLYINFVYVNVNQEIYLVYLYDPQGEQTVRAEYITRVDTREELEAACADRYSVGIDLSRDEPELYMISSGLDTADHYRAVWAEAAVEGISGSRIEAAVEGMSGSRIEAAVEGMSVSRSETIGTNNREMKNRREITAEFLFFELAAVGFLGLASMLFKEKQMGVIRVHGILPVSRPAFIFSKLLWLLASDLAFAALLTVINLGLPEGFAVLPAVLVQAGILSLIMALVGFLCAISLPDFKQFSLFYLVIAVFVITPVFLAGQTGISWGWLAYHPMYHLFRAMKSAYFAAPMTDIAYYLICAGGIGLLLLLAHRALAREMAKEG